MVSTEIRLIILFTDEDREALYSQQKQDQELTVALIMNSLLQKSDFLKQVEKTIRPLRYDLNQIPYNYAVEVTNDFCFIDYAEALIVWITTNCGKFLERWEYQTTWPLSCETCMQVNKQQLEQDITWIWNNGLVPDWERGMSKLYIVTLLI